MITTGPGGRSASAKRPDASTTVVARRRSFQPLPPRRTSTRKGARGRPVPDSRTTPTSVPPRVSSTVASSPARATTARAWAKPSRDAASRWRPGPRSLRVNRPSASEVAWAATRSSADPGPPRRSSRAETSAPSTGAPPERTRPVIRGGAGLGRGGAQLHQHAPGGAGREVERDPPGREPGVAGLERGAVGGGEREGAGRAARRALRGGHERAVAGVAADHADLGPLDRTPFRVLHPPGIRPQRLEPEREAAHPLPGTGVEHHRAVPPLRRERGVARRRGGRELPAPGLGRLEPEGTVGGAADRGGRPTAGEGDLRAGQSGRGAPGADRALEGAAEGGGIGGRARRRSPARTSRAARSPTRRERRHGWFRRPPRPGSRGAGARAPGAPARAAPARAASAWRRRMSVGAYTRPPGARGDGVDAGAPPC